MSRIFIKLMIGFVFLLFWCQMCPNTFAQVQYPFRYSSFVWNRPLQDVAFGNGTFVAIAPLTTTILNSTDGVHWTNHSSNLIGLQTNCADINFSTETYSAGGDTVTFLSASHLSDADAQTNRQSVMGYLMNQIPRPLTSITFGHGIFVIVGYGGLILTSHDGEHWVAEEHRKPGSASCLYGVAAGDSGFVAVGQDGIIYSSPDGLVWTQRDSGTDLPFYNVAYGNGTYVAFANNATIHTSVFTSSDGVKWTSNNRDLGQIKSIAFGNGVFLGTMTFDGFPPKLNGQPSGKWMSGPTVISTDGKNWREVAPPIPSEGLGPFNAYFPTHLTFGGGLFIATAFGVISTSKDGMHWTPSDDLKSEYYGAAYGNGIFVAVGNGAVIKDTNSVSITAMTIAHSKDAITWEYSPCPPSRLLWGNLINEHTFKMGYDFGLADTNATSDLRTHIGVGSGGRQRFFTMGTEAALKNTNEYSYLVTSDGGTWTTPDKTAISGFISGNRHITYTDKAPVVLTSQDGIVWTRLAPIHSDRPAPAIAGNNQNAVVSENVVAIKLNGQVYQLNLTSHLGQSMEIQASTDLESWDTLTTITNNGGILNFVDRDVTNYPARFYRLKLR
jgi:photosystem II stability/assembly factor-like uncharacterized protein